MGWLPLIGTAVGAVIALSGTLLADVRRDRHARLRDQALDRRGACVEFALALDAAHAGLRAVARARVPGVEDRRSAANQAVQDAGLYGARERLLMSGTPVLVTAGERAFMRLIGIRNVVRDGASIDSTAYHDAYHDFAEQLWTFRGAVRADVGQPEFTPEGLGRIGWSERESCPRCAQLPAQAPLRNSEVLRDL